MEIKPKQNLNIVSFWSRWHSIADQTVDQTASFYSFSDQLNTELDEWVQRQLIWSLDSRFFVSPFTGPTIQHFHIILCLDYTNQFESEFLTHLLKFELSVKKI